MAQKTFKIGLSDTNKQNMAQDVYERLINMCFDTYNSANTYNEGDFVVYENPSDTFKLYKCLEDNVTGAWDSTKWQLATFQDLVDDIEGAVAFVNDKANTDGNYPTMTVGFADNLTPYDDESGDDQDEPFSFQATGTGNGSQADFATGSAALLKEKQGNTVVVNQWTKELNSTNWEGADTNVSFADGVATFTATVQYATFKTKSVGKPSMIENHKYLIILEHKGTTTYYNVYFNSGQYISDFLYNVSDNNFTLRTQVFTYAKASGEPILIFQDNRASDWTEQQIKNLALIDLTQWFGSNDNIPQDILDNPEHFFRYYQGSLAYNEGTLVNSNGRYIKCIGRQQWDEEVTNGIYDENGQPVEYANYCRNTNFIRVIPGLTYYLYKGSANSCTVFFYDQNKNFIKYTQGIINQTFTIPANCCYINFHFAGSTYNHDITISIYYDGESGYDQYYPYQVLSNIDTGTEVLRSAGNAKDSKAPDNTITRRVGTVDLGSFTWNYSDGVFYTSFVAKARTRNILCSKYNNPYTSNTGLGSMIDKTIQSRTDTDAIYIKDSAYTDAATFKTAMSGVYLFYELAEPTTEQGTSFSANLSIDDFGSMDFGGANGVPQGALIFYPVDYKAFVDTLYDYAEGTPSSLAKKTDLPTAPQTWAESLPGYDATKTQTLKNVQGTLTWVDDE